MVKARQTGVDERHAAHEVEMLFCVKGVFETALYLFRDGLIKLFDVQY